MACVHCKKGQPIETEVDGAGFMVVYEPDPTHGLRGFCVDVYDMGSADPTYTFTVPFCPACGERWTMSEAWRTRYAHACAALASSNAEVGDLKSEIKKREKGIARLKRQRDEARAECRRLHGALDGNIDHDKEQR